MTALTQDVIRRARGDGSRDEIAIATSSKIYVGSLCCVRTNTGRVVAATGATGRRIQGVCVGFAGAVLAATDGKGGQTGNTSGTVRAVVEYDREYEFTVKTALRSNNQIGLNLFVADDDTVGGTAIGTAGKRIAVGMLTKFSNTDKTAAYIAVRRFGPTNTST